MKAKLNLFFLAAFTFICSVSFSQCIITSPEVDCGYTSTYPLTWILNGDNVSNTQVSINSLPFAQYPMPIDYEVLNYHIEGPNGCTIDTTVYYLNLHLSQNELNFCQGSFSSPITCEGVFPDNLTLTYQWYVSPDSSSLGNLLQNETGSSYTPLIPNAITKYYSCVVEIVGNSCFSQTLQAEVNVTSSFQLNAITPLEQEICQGVSPILQVSSNPAGSSIHYQWYSNSTNSTTTSVFLPNDTLNSLTTNLVELGPNYFYCVASTLDSVCFIQSQIFEIIVVEQAEISQQPISSSVCNGTSGLELCVDYINATGNPAYQWYSSLVNDNTAGVAVSGANSSCFTPPTSQSGQDFYYVKIDYSGIGCESRISNCGNVSVIDYPVSNLLDTLYACNANTLNLFLEEIGDNTVVWNNQLANNSTISIADGDIVTVSITESLANCETTDLAHVVFVQSSGGNLVNSQVLCENQSELIVESTVSSSSNYPDYSFWEFSTDGIQWSYLDSTSSESLVLSNNYQSDFSVRKRSKSYVNNFTCLSEPSNSHFVDLFNHNLEITSASGMLCNGSSNIVYECSGCDSQNSQWTIEGGEINTDLGSSVIVDWFADHTGISQLTVEENDPLSSCVSVDSIEITFSEFPAPPELEILLIDETFGLLGSVLDGQYTVLWGTTNYLSGQESVSCESQNYCEFGTLDTLNYAYWVELTLLGGCHTRSYFNSQLINTINDNEWVIGTKVFPNPSNESFSIILPDQRKYELYLTDTFGNVVESFTSNGTSMYRFGERLAQGLYLLKVIDSQNKTSECHKLIKI
jgi:hypothetical protein